MIAISIILQTIKVGDPAVVQVGLGFLGTALMGRFFGVLWAGIGAGLADVLNSIIIGVPGGFYPGFTISAIAGGIIYGTFLYNQNFAGDWKKVWRIVVSVLLITIIVNTGLNTLWMTLKSGADFNHLLIQRLPKQVTVPWVQMIILYLTMVALDRVKIESILNRYSK
ncbi:integral membrane protein [Holzapfeliella floricola DSM 23037 = JCM 16512]|uniref:Integral membrane protein n=2 Tax=Holzapfeliella TaxID=2767883 RepID=A0A0R2DUR7_9LACO|nr:integral membrane protein [Holzapfeliella floricola DSM 23037 = JCM 16512]